MTESLRNALLGSSPEGIATALLALNAERPGLAYDVGMALCAARPTKDFPGPEDGWYPKNPYTADVFVLRIDPSLRIDGMRALRAVTCMTLPELRSVFDDIVQCPVRVLARVSHAEASEKANELRKAGFEVSIDFGDDQAPKSHVRTLHPYVGPAMA